VSNSMSGCHSKAGRLFQILGPATEKLLLPSWVFVLGTVRTLAWLERSWGHPECTTSWQSSSLTSQRLVDVSGQLVVDLLLLLHWKPVQATKNWWYHLLLWEPAVEALSEPLTNRITWWCYTQCNKLTV